MKFLVLLYSLLMLGEKALAEEKLITLLEIAHSNSSKVVRYQAKLKDCKFKDVSRIRVDIFDRSKNEKPIEPSIIEEVYYNVETLFSVEEFLDFQVSAVKNLKFHFELNNCQLAKFLDYNETRYRLKDIEVSYHNYLAFPTLKEVKAVVIDDNLEERTIIIPYFNAEGYIPFYEAHIGLGINLWENIRPSSGPLKDQTTFRKKKLMTEPLPIVLMRYGPLFINKDGAGVLLLPTKNFALLWATIIDGEPYKAEGIEERERSFFSGWIAKIYWLTFFYFKDIEGKSHGENMRVQWEHNFVLNRFITLSPHIFVQWWDDDYMNYYYGVRASEESIVGRPYNARHTQNMEIMLKTYLKQDRTKWIFAVGEKWYGKNVSASPLVRKDTEFRIIFGASYQFL